jgi:hypothetical protein
MNVKILVILALTAASSIAQQSINFGSQIPSTGTDSYGVAWDTAGTFQFELGVFTSGFVASSSNTDLWASNWTIANQGGPTGVAQWVNDDGDLGFTGSAQISTLSAPFTASTGLYLWGYDSKAIGNRQWILLTNTAWVVSSDISNPVTSSFIVDGSTTAVIGGVNSPSNFQSALVTASPIPEPATYAALLGLGGLGFAVYLRRRSVA